MAHGEKITPVAAAVTALATLACCMPIGFAAAAAFAGVAAFVAPLRGWFIGASLLLLGIGIVQVNRKQRTCAIQGRTAWASITILSVAGAVVVLVAFFPQVIAGLLADWMP